MTAPPDRCSVNTLIESPGISPVAGVVRWDPIHSFWNGGMLAVSLVFAPILLSWSALLIFVLLTGGTLLLGHSVGFHRRLIHRSFDCPVWLGRDLVLGGNTGGMSRPLLVDRNPGLR